MKGSTILIALLGLVCFASTASATTYSFNAPSLGITFDSPTAGADFTFVAGPPAVATVTYDEVTKRATVNMSGTATVHGVQSAYSYVMDFFNVIPIANPAGVLGFGGAGATSDGRLNIANVGDITGDGINDSVVLDLAAKFMNFAGWTQAPYTELVNLGSANFFLWQSASANSILAKAWLGTDILYVNGVNRNGLFTSIAGDMHLGGGTQNTQVPEPATALLLGMGALGGAIRRRKAA